MTHTTPAPVNTNTAKYTVAAAHPQARQRLDRGVRIDDRGCWVWRRATSQGGYGLLTCNKQLVYAHRLSFWIHRGPVPDGMVVDHLCRNRACVNPDHLQAVTQATNMARGSAGMLRECARGHLFSAANTNRVVDRNGHEHRNCRECNKARAKAWRSNQN